MVFNNFFSSIFHPLMLKIYPTEHLENLHESWLHAICWTWWNIFRRTVLAPFKFKSKRKTKIGFLTNVYNIVDRLYTIFRYNFTKFHIFRKLIQTLINNNMISFFQFTNLSYLYKSIFTSKFSIFLIFAQNHI